MKAENILIRTGQKAFDDLFPRVKWFLERDVLEVNFDGERVKGYRSPDAKSIWLRDHSDMMRAAKYFETDLKSTVDHFAATQAANGRIFDYFTTFPEKLPCEKENWTKYVRVPVEADVEFRFIKAAFIAWQATGDDDWISGLIPNIERALDYIFTNPQRIDAATGLVKRAYTIDTWDFAYTAGKHNWLQFQIDDNTFWGIFHGDNSGYYEALNILAILYEYFGERLKAQGSRLKAKELRGKVQDMCWNGEFFTHFVKLTPVTIPGVDESRQLSMANPMSINRGIATHEMAVSIIKEYQKRKETTNAFAEWFSIDPPFPDGIFGDEKLVGGAYINGGIFPLAGAELAKAAFEHGFEEYGVSILKQYYKLISEKNETFLWYSPDGTPCSVENSTSPEAMPTDGWGSSAMAWALIEGLAGIEDRLKRFEKIRLSPRWLAAGITEAEVGVGYQVPAFAGMTEKGVGYQVPAFAGMTEKGVGYQVPAFAGMTEKGVGYQVSGVGNTCAGVQYLYKYTSAELVINLECHAEVDFHVLIGSEDVVSSLEVNGLLIKYQIEMIGQSQYVNFSARIEDQADIRITFNG
ncbi:MAG: hypothetical protein NTV01_22485 [Bacteroidia bacterium]|nr:hypothetical protein [Bacteroidia bacterium]